MADWTALIVDTFAQFVTALGAILPRVLAAIALAALGIVVARLARGGVLRLARDVDRLLGRMFGQRFSVSALRTPWPLSRILAAAVYWLVLFFFVIVIANLLGFATMAASIEQFARYLPTIVAALVVVAIGAAATAVARDAIASLPWREAASLAKAAQLLLALIVGVIALDQLGIEVGLLATVIAIAAAALLGSIALAFGLGARSTVTNLIAAQYVRANVARGQRVRIDGIEGVVLEIAPTAVVLESAHGRVNVPAARFEQVVSTVVIGEGPARAE